MSNDFARFARGLEILDRTLQGEAKLEGLEHSLKVRLTARAHGHIGLVVEITPDDLTQRHSFEFELDQTFLAPVRAQCAEILRRFPVVLQLKPADAASGAD